MLNANEKLLILADEFNETKGMKLIWKKMYCKL